MGYPVKDSVGRYPVKISKDKKRPSVSNGQDRKDTHSVAFPMKRRNIKELKVDVKYSLEM